MSIHYRVGFCKEAAAASEATAAANRGRTIALLCIVHEGSVDAEKEVVQQDIEKRSVTVL